MFQLIHLIRRTILKKTQTLHKILQIQPKIQTPISYFTQTLSTQSQQPTNSTSFVSKIKKPNFDDKLLRLLRAEKLRDSSLQQPPAEFKGFKVNERVGEKWISLTKQFREKERINIEVSMFDGSVQIPKEGDNSDDDQPGEEEVLHITLIITIFKGEYNQVLEFICSAWPDTVEIQKFFVREPAEMAKSYTGPMFGDLDDQLQDTLYEFLAERGIDENLCVFLHNYIKDYKYTSEYIRWIDTLKKAVSTTEKK